MKAVLIEESPMKLRLVLKRSRHDRIVGTAAGLLFCVVGSAFLFSAFPHAEFLRIVREEGRVEGVAGRVLPWGTVIDARSLLTEKPVTAVVEEAHDEDGTIYRTFLQAEDERISFGKVKRDQQEADQAVGRVNEFLEAHEGAIFQYNESVWWWFLLPFGLLGLAAGAFTLFVFLQSDVWIFDRSSNLVIAELRVFLPFRVKRRSLSGVRSATVLDRTGADGDTSRHLRLTLDTGEMIDMSAVAERSGTSANLRACAERITRFLLQRSVHLSSLPAPDTVH